MIKYWRNKENTDDGCSIYECLSCYNTWEARTCPKWSEWKYCPYCGVEWEGEKEWLEYGDGWKIIRPARLEQRKGIDRRRLEQRISLQQRSVWRCKDGYYVLHRDNWESTCGINNPVEHYGCEKDDEKFGYRYWEDVQNELYKKYDRRGTYVYYCKLVQFILDTVRGTEGEKLFSLMEGMDFRIVVRQEKGYNNVVSESVKDLGGYRYDGSKYVIREPDCQFEFDDLEGDFEDHSAA